MRLLSVLWVWLNGGRIATIQLDATTLFPNSGWLHSGALCWVGNGWLVVLRSPCQKPKSPPLGYLRAVFFKLFLWKLNFLPKNKELKKKFLVTCRQRLCQHLPFALVFASCTIEESQKVTSQQVVQRVVALVRERVVKTPWPSLASFTLRPDPSSTYHPWPHLRPRSSQLIS